MNLQVQQFLQDMKEHSAAQRMERDKEVPQRSQSSAASLTSIGADISPSSSHFFEVITFLHPHILFEERGYINYYPT